MSMPMTSAAETASMRSCRLVQYSSVSSSSQFFHEQTGDVVASLFEQQGGYRGIDTSGHADDYSRSTHD